MRYVGIEFRVALEPLTCGEAHKRFIIAIVTLPLDTFVSIYGVSQKYNSLRCRRQLTHIHPQQTGPLCWITFMDEKAVDLLSCFIIITMKKSFLPAAQYYGEFGIVF